MAKQIMRNDYIISTVAIIVGAGPAGLATAATLTLNSIPYILLERQDCYASLWKKYSYDRLLLHLHKHFCQLPHFPFPPSSPTYVPRVQFLNYLDDYVAHFNICPKYRRNVESASYNDQTGKWVVVAATSCGKGGVEVEYYSSRFLVVASGEACDPFVPEVDGLGTFTAGDVIHSTGYKNGKSYSDRSVLVVGSGNSGMEIALDLANHGAKTSIVVRSPMHVLTRWAVSMGLSLLKYNVPLGLVDQLLLWCGTLVYGDLSKYGIARPEEGPFYMKVTHGKYPVIDVGTVNQIKYGEIQVLPAVKRIKGNEVVFEDGKSHPFDAIVFCTGFKRSVKKWLKGDDYLLSDDGLSKQKYPNHWKGKNGLYCIGLARRGLYAINEDAQNIANDIKSVLV